MFVYNVNNVNQLDDEIVVLCWKHVNALNGKKCVLQTDL